MSNPEDPLITSPHYAWWYILRRQLEGLQLQIHGHVHDQTLAYTALWEHMLRMEQKIMSALDDLKAQDDALEAGAAALKTTVISALGNLLAKVQAGQTISEADIEAEAARVGAVVTDLGSLASTASADDPGVAAAPVTPDQPVVDPTDPSADVTVTPTPDPPVDPSA